MVEKEHEVRTEVEDCENYRSSACFLICDDVMHKDNIPYAFFPQKKQK